MKTISVCGALVALLATMSSPVQAAYVTTFGEDRNSSATNPLTQLPNSLAAQQNFLSNLKGVGVQDFESFKADTGQPLTLTFPSANSGNGLTATLEGNGKVAANPAGKTDNLGRYSVPLGNQYWLANALAGSFKLTFSTPIAAFGFYGVDIGDFGGSLLLDLVTPGSTSQTTVRVPNTVGVNGGTDGSVLFFGLAATTPAELFTSVTFRLTGRVDADFDEFAFDSFTIAEAAQIGAVDPTPNPNPGQVPEPGSLALAAVALVGLGVASQGRRKA